MTINMIYSELQNDQSDAPAIIHENIQIVAPVELNSQHDAENLNVDSSMDIIYEMWEDMNNNLLRGPEHSHNESFNHTDNDVVMVESYEGVNENQESLEELLESYIF